MSLSVVQHERAQEDSNTLFTPKAGEHLLVAVNRYVSLTPPQLSVIRGCLLPMPCPIVSARAEGLLSPPPPILPWLPCVVWLPVANTGLTLVRLHY